MITSILQKLSTPLPVVAIQKTEGKDTRKGYDTTGYGYMYAIDRFNEELGESWGYNWEIINHEKGSYKSGAPYHDITIKIEIWINDKLNSRSCVGGHTSITYADALKGAITNGFKKTAAFWGVGRDAYAGTIDDDNNPLPDEAKNKVDCEKLYFDLMNKIEVCQKVAQMDAVQNEIKANVHLLKQIQVDALRDTFKRRKDELKLQEVAS